MEDSSPRNSHPDFKLEEGILSVLLETRTDLEFVLRMSLWRVPYVSHKVT
jgi:hypothetical protein